MSSGQWEALPQRRRKRRPDAAAAAAGAAAAAAAATAAADATPTGDAPNHQNRLLFGTSESPACGAD